MPVAYGIQSGAAGSKGGYAPAKSALKVLVLYEHLGTALRAKRSPRPFAGQRGAQTGLHTRLWRLDLLPPALAGGASGHRGARGGRDHLVPPQAQAFCRPKCANWLNRWLDHKEDRPYALAVLLSGQNQLAPASRSPVVAYLQRVAETAHANRFCESCGGIDLA